MNMESINNIHWQLLFTKHCQAWTAVQLMCTLLFVLVHFPTVNRCSIAEFTV